MEGPRRGSQERANIKDGEQQYARQGALEAMSSEEVINEDPEVKRIDSEIMLAKQNQDSKTLETLRDHRGERVRALRQQKGFPN